MKSFLPILFLAIALSSTRLGAIEIPEIDPMEAEHHPVHVELSLDVDLLVMEMDSIQQRMRYFREAFAELQTQKCNENDPVYVELLLYFDELMMEMLMLQQQMHHVRQRFAELQTQKCNEIVTTPNPITTTPKPTTTAPNPTATTPKPTTTTPKPTTTTILHPTPPPTPHQSTLPACVGTEADIVVVVDSSTSVTEPNFRLQMNFVKGLVEKADVTSGAVRFGLLTFSTEVHIEFHLNEYSTKNEYIQAIGNVIYRFGSTNTAAAIETMRTEMFTRQNGDRPNVSNIGILLTDGISNMNTRRTIPEAEASKGAGITIYAIGIGIQDTNELDAIANKPLDEYRFIAEDITDLVGLDKQLLKSICGEAPETPAAPK